MQPNYHVSLFQKGKRDIYNKLIDKNICDNRKFWKVVKLLLSKKIVSNEKIILTEDQELSKLKTNQENPKVLHDFLLTLSKILIFHYRIK